MDKFSLKQVLEKIISVKELNVSESDIINIQEQHGGLVNYIFRIETKKGLFFLKQFLEKLKAIEESEIEFDALKNIETGSKDRIDISYKAENQFEKILGREKHIVPHIYFYNEKEGYLIIEGFEKISSLLEKIKNATFPKQPILSLAKSIAKIHQETFIERNENFDLYNNKWLDLKLKYTFYEMVKLLDKKTAKILQDFADNYKKQRFVLTHGDLCSINIFLSDKEEAKIHLIDFEDAHIGAPSFDLGYLLSEYFVAGENFPEKKKEIHQNIREFLDTYFFTFNKQDRNTVEIETTMHTANMMLFRTFGLSKDTFTKYLKNDVVRNSVKDNAISMIKNSNEPISYFVS